MGVTHSPRIRDGICNLVAAQVGQGATLQFRNNGKAAATLRMADMPFGAPSDGRMQAQPLREDMDAAGSDAPCMVAVIVSADGEAALQFDVFSKGADGQRIAGIRIGPHDRVRVASFIYTACP